MECKLPSIPNGHLSFLNSPFPGYPHILKTLILTREKERNFETHIKAKRSGLIPRIINFLEFQAYCPEIDE